MVNVWMMAAWPKLGFERLFEIPHPDLAALAATWGVDRENRVGGYCDERNAADLVAVAAARRTAGAMVDTAGPGWA